MSTRQHLIDAQDSIQAALDELQSAPSDIPRADKWTLPIPGDPARVYSAQGHSLHHTGHDFNYETGGDSDLGAPVVSVSSGLVVFAGKGRGAWGNLVIVLYVSEAVTWWRYAHLNSTFVHVGQAVKTGERIGTVGKGADNRYWAHLHLDCWAGIMIDPSTWLRNYNFFFDPVEFLRARNVPDIDAFVKRG